MNDDGVFGRAYMWEPVMPLGPVNFRNATLFWLKGKCAAIAVGYYLGPDDVWRQHAWGVMGDGTILDTDSGGQITVVRD